MVEAAGIEPASENLQLGASTYISGFQFSLFSPLTGNGRKKLTYVKFHLTGIGDLLD
jgi:hypothetical protein